MKAIIRKICILLSTYNGEKYLEDLLESIYLQKTNNEIQILARDDGSNDRTLEILYKWKESK